MSKKASIYLIVTMVGFAIVVAGAYFILKADEIDEIAEQEISLKGSDEINPDEILEPVNPPEPLGDISAEPASTSDEINPDEILEPVNPPEPLGDISAEPASTSDEINPDEILEPVNSP